MKFTLRLKQTFPFPSNVPIVELEGERILANNVVFPGDFNYHSTRLWVLGNEYGAMGAVWADCEQDAWDELCDAGLAGGVLIDEDTLAGMDESEREELTYLGNAGEPADLTHAWMAVVKLNPAKDAQLIVALAEARGACDANLDKVSGRAFATPVAK